MPKTGLSFEKEKDSLTDRILNFFERTRYAYLSAKEDPSEYTSEWKKVVNMMKED